MQVKQTKGPESGLGGHHIITI